MNLNITEQDMTDFYNVISKEKGNAYINYAQDYMQSNEKKTKRAIRNDERHDIITEAMMATASFYIKSPDKKENEWERYYFITIKNILKRKIRKSPMLPLDDIIETKSNCYIDENFDNPCKEQITLEEIDIWLKSRLVEGKIVPLDYSIFRVRHVLNRTIVEISEKLGYSKSFVRGRCNNIIKYIKEELSNEYFV